MPPQHWLDAFTLLFNIVGAVVCIAGLTLAQRMTRRWPGYVLAGIGFLIAATPMIYQAIMTMLYSQ
ncbi:hypothetical protein R5M92_01735 [Halomonas sp. Bachu 37]|uniref:hypothetical protein n=1 Tax=Halomonas kashgarensis TaxID=3084920 RepID=UPI003216258E